MNSKIRRLKRLAPTILVAALLAATATAFAVTEHLKLEDSPVIRTTFAARFSPKLVEEVEDRGRLTLECVAALVPVGAAEPAVHELVPVLEVEAQQELGHG